MADDRKIEFRRIGRFDRIISKWIIMKNRIKKILLFALTIVVSSCNELPKKVAEIEKKVVKTEKAEKKKEQDILREELKNTTPVNVDHLEALIPKTFGGLSLERTKSNSIFGEVQMFGFYKREGDKMIQISITDAAGPNGSMAADKIGVLGTERESDTEDIQLRSVNVNGRMARQDYHAKANMTIILFFHKNRFLIMITAHNHNVEETWALVDELNFEMLDKLAQ